MFSDPKSRRIIMELFMELQKQMEADTEHVVCPDTNDDGMWSCDYGAYNNI